MADLHIEDFYRDVATILLRLYASFPRKITLYVDDVSGPDQPDEFGLHHPRFQAGFGAMIWLAEQGYLEFEETIRQEAIDQAVLTRRGFLLLSCPVEPDLLKNEETAASLPPSVQEEAHQTIASLRRAVKDGSSIVIRRCVSALLARPPVGE